MGKLAPGSLHTHEDQIRWYRELMGDVKADEQVRLARKEARKCICSPRLVKRKWMGSERVTQRSVHDVECPKWKPWMAEVNSG